MKGVWILIIISLFLMNFIVAGITSKAILNNSQEGDNEFCGISTLRACETDSNCVKAGCSNSICQSKDEEPVVTTCEYQECSNSEKYKKECKCNENKCKWEDKENEDKIDNEDNECEAWKCTKWSACLNETKTRKCVAIANCINSDEKEEEDIPKISKSCYEKEKLNHNKKSFECPEKCTCTGSVIKCMFANGTREMTIVAGNSGNTMFQVKGVNASTQVTLYKSDEGKIYVVKKNNETRVVKMLPDQVRERIKERLQSQLENENIILDESGTYQYRAEKRVRLFNFWGINMPVNAEINSETGEVIRLKKAWWAFFASEDGELIVGASCGTVTPGQNDACCQTKGYNVWNAELAECQFNSEE